jgi:hypothetical protein
MKVYSHKWNKNNERICVGPYVYICTAPLGVLRPQPKTPQEVQVLVLSKMFNMVDDAPAKEEGTDYVESHAVKAEPVVEVFSLTPPADAVLEEMLEAAESVAAELDNEFIDVESDLEPEVEQLGPEVPENPEFANYSTGELLGLCESLNIKVRKNASRASLIEKLVAAAKG